jgi:hypothetical protein
VAAWHFEPLPPQEMSARWDDLPIWRMLDSSGSRRARWAKRTLLFPAMALAAWRMNQDGGPYRYHTGNYVLAFQSFLSLREGLRSGWLDAVFVTTNQKVRFLAGRGIAATFAPFGYHPHLGAIRSVPRDIDVVFLGKVQNERRRTLTRVVEEARSLGVEVRVVDRDCWGEKRTTLLNRTKIMLHLHNFPWDTPWQRWMIAGANGAMVVSEPLSLPDPLVPGIHYAEAPIEKMAAALRHYVVQAEERQRMADALARLVRDDMSLDRSAARILEVFGMLPATQATQGRGPMRSST